MPKTIPNNEQYKLKDGRVVKIGDIVRYKWGSFPIGYIHKIEKKWGRWKSHVRTFGYEEPYANINTNLCDFDYYFSFVTEEDLKNEGGEFNSEA
jgi:hypothetical protein